MPEKEKPKSNTPEYRREYDKKKKKDILKRGIINKAPVKREWKKNLSSKTLDPAIVDYYIQNDLPLDEYYDSITLYDYEWVNGKKRKIEKNDDD
jgi:hypothetical protein